MASGHWQCSAPLKISDSKEASRMALSWESLCQKVQTKRHFLTPLFKSEHIFLLNKFLRETCPTFSVSPLFGFRSSYSSMQLTNSPPYLLSVLSCLGFLQYLIGSLFLKLLPSSFPRGFCILACLTFYEYLRGFCQQSLLVRTQESSWKGNC